MRQLPEEALMDRGVAESILTLLMMSGYTQVVDRDGVVSVRVDGDVSLTAGYADQMRTLVEAVRELRPKEGE